MWWLKVVSVESEDDDVQDKQDEYYQVDEYGFIKTKTE